MSQVMIHDALDGVRMRLCCPHSPHLWLQAGEQEAELAPELQIGRRQESRFRRAEIGQASFRP